MSRWPAALTPLVLGSLAVAWTWPAASSLGPTLAGLHFDLPGTAWFIDASPRLIEGGLDPMTGWPEGQAYARPDSWLLMGLAGLLGGPPWLHGLLSVLGVTLSAWAAEAFARALGARPPYSLIAGLAFGFSGLAATALLEGHVYHVVDPWLPLFGWSWLRATRPGGRPVHGLAAALTFALTTLTTAYLGLAAAVIALGFAGEGLRRHGRRFPLTPAALAAGGVLIFAALYLGSFGDGGLVEGLPGYDARSRMLYLMARSAEPVGLLVATPEVDLLAHSSAATFSITALALAAFAPLVLEDAAPWRPLLLTGGVALLLSLGPWLPVGELWIPLPLAFLSELPAMDLLRHPARLGWGFALCFGVLAARVATELGSARRLALLLPGMVVIEAFVLVGLPLRQGQQLGARPSAYDAAEGAVLDLYPTEPGVTYELNGWFQAWACLYQARGEHPVADDCVVTRVADNPRVALAEAVLASLLEGDLHGARGRLEEARISALALHGDLFTPGDRRRLEAALEQLDPAPTVSVDGGEHVALYAVGAAPMSLGHDPSDKLLLRARSEDGLRWEKVPGVLAEAASSPHLTLVGGEPVVFYTDHGERVATVPLAGGEPSPVDLPGLEGLAVDPHHVATPGGGRRLYFIHQPAAYDPGDGLDNAVRSARWGGDGWVVEPGARLEGAIVDPEVVPADGGWRMYFTEGATRVGSAWSEDGLGFTREEGWRLEGSGVSSTVLRPDGAWMYTHHMARIRRASSEDGLRFVDDGVVLELDPRGPDRGGVESPSVLEVEGRWWMVYAAVEPDARPMAPIMPPGEGAPLPPGME